MFYHAKFYHAKKIWELPASAATPERLFLSRREALLGLGASLIPLGAYAEEAVKTADLYPAKRNDAAREEGRKPTIDSRQGHLPTSERSVEQGVGAGEFQQAERAGNEPPRAASLFNL